jgi:hypothetical protein
MLAVMRYRRSKYSTRMQRAGPQWKRSLPVFTLVREKSPGGRHAPASTLLPHNRPKVRALAVGFGARMDW